MSVDEDYSLKPLLVDKDKTAYLPLWFNHILHNKMMPKIEQSNEAIEDTLHGGNHFYCEYGKPISTLIDFSKMDIND